MTLGSHAAILQNLSKFGAKLVFDGTLKKGSSWFLRWHGLEAFGTVLWSSGTHCGVSLNSPVPEPIMRSTLGLNETHRVREEDAGRLAARAWAEGSGHFGFD
jgi:hypothetical protein